MSRIIERVEHGEEIVISRAGQPPVAKVVPLVRRVDRTGRGSLRGKFALNDGLDSDETNAEIARDFGVPP